MNAHRALLALAAALAIGLGPARSIAQQDAAPPAAAWPDRTVLPLAEPTHPPITELDARKATPPPRFEVKAPAGAPNVLIILIDDVGAGKGTYHAVAPTPQ